MIGGGMQTNETTQPPDDALLNEFIVGATADIDNPQISILRPPTTPISQRRALVLAAWLVALADPLDEEFPAILKAIKST